MRASSRSRRGLGAMFAFVLWVLAIALIYALSQSQAQSGALTGVARVAAMRAVAFAGASALEEASYVLRNPSGDTSTVMDAVLAGGRAGTALEPEVTRATYRKLHDDQQLGGEITIGPVTYEMVKEGRLPPGTPPGSRKKAPWLVDLAVKVEFRAGPVRLARTVRRRHIAHEMKVVETMGPRRGEVIARSLALRREVFLEVME